MNALSPTCYSFFSVPRTRWAVSTECSTGGEDTSSRRPRHPAHPCSSSRRTCPSTSPLVRNMSRIELETFQEHCYASRCIIFRARFFFILYCAFSYLHQLINFVPIKFVNIVNCNGYYSAFIFFLQGSQVTWGPTPAARPSLSVSSTTGRLCPGIPCR